MTQQLIDCYPWKELKHLTHNILFKSFALWCKDNNARLSIKGILIWQYLWNEMFSYLQNGGQGQKAHTRGTDPWSKNSDAVGSAAEIANVLTYPAQSLDLIQIP